MKKIVFTGGSGRFARAFKKVKHKYRIEYPSKKQLNIEDFESILNYLNRKKPNYLIHCAGLSRPMKIHDKNVAKSILINIIGTSNIVRACNQKKIKLIYFSTNYVYPGIKGNYSEYDPVLPINNYAVSKLGGECAVRMYKNSLILRICMTEKPFVHKVAFNDVEMNFMFHEELALNLLKLINKKGIINVGGPRQKVYKFAKKTNPKVRAISAKKILGNKFPLNQSMNIDRYLKILKE